MLRIDRNQKSFVQLTAPTLAQSAITERYDLQEYIFNSPDKFFPEIGQNLFLLGKEVMASADVQDRIDLLAVDKEGACVIVELKRGNHKFHMLQAISYAGMVSQWSAEELLELLESERRESLAEFLDCEPEDINRRQRIILLAEAYDYALLIAAQWLGETHGVDIACCRLAIAKDGDAEYLVCTNVHPAPEIVEQAIVRGKKGGGKPAKWTDWSTALKDVNNAALAAYFRQEIDNNREDYLAKRILRFRLANKRRWNVSARRKNAYVWQNGRFAGDVEFWAGKLASTADVRPVKEGQCLRFSLESPADFNAFHEAATKGLSSVVWTAEGDDADGSSSDGA